MTRQDRIVVMVVVAAALAAASWFLLIRPEREKAAELAAQVEQAQLAADDAAGAVATAVAAQRGYREDYAALVQLGKAVPTDDDIASFVYQLDAAAEQTGVDFRAVSVTDTGQAEGAQPSQSGQDKESGGGGGTTLPGQVTAVPVTLSFEGGFFEMTRFLRKIERYTVVAGDDIDVRGRLVSVESINMTTATEGFPNVKAEVTANLYRAPLPSVEEGAAGQGAQPAADASSTGVEQTTASAGSPGAGSKTAVIGVTK